MAREALATILGLAAALGGVGSLPSMPSGDPKKRLGPNGIRARLANAKTQEEVAAIINEADGYEGMSERTKNKIANAANAALERIRNPHPGATNER